MQKIVKLHNNLEVILFYSFLLLINITLISHELKSVFILIILTSYRKSFIEYLYKKLKQFNEVIVDFSSKL